MAAKGLATVFLHGKRHPGSARELFRGLEVGLAQHIHRTGKQKYA